MIKISITDKKVIQMLQNGQNWGDNDWIKPVADAGSMNEGSIGGKPDNGLQQKIPNYEQNSF